MHGSNVRIHGEDRVLGFIVPVFHGGPDMDSRGMPARKTYDRVDENYTAVRASFSHYY